ncbi:MAG: AmmeMemoRadiSam system protein A [Magnetococcales bacterium]|nr:AmmeMemoRadiSam system protein A [Magnetococcales bacterium]
MNQGAALIAWTRRHLAERLAGGEGVSPETVETALPETHTPGACFITLTEGGALRGCVGSLAAHRPLSTDLLENAVAAATRDPRFSPLTREALERVRIEISLLTPAQPLPYDGPEDLLRKLQPGVHGVILQRDGRRSTFLPQVWEQLPDPRVFLEHLCRKAGLMGDCWQRGANIQVYTVEKFKE